MEFKRVLFRFRVFFFLFFYFFILINPTLYY